MNIQRRHLVTGILVGSVALNLLLLGAILGRVVTGPPPLRSLPPTMGWVMRGLEPEEREAIRPLVADQIKETVAAQRALADAQRTAARLMRAEKIDEAALTDAFARLRRASGTSQEAMHATLVRVMAALTPEQRERVVGYMRGGWRGDAGRRPAERRGPRAPRERKGPLPDRMPPPPSPEMPPPEMPPPEAPPPENVPSDAS